jgi:RNA polymerase sigma factor (sigma-70 family)
MALMTGRLDIAEELAQEAFVQVCKHWERVRGYDAPGAWVHRVAVNLALSQRRRSRAERRAIARVGSRPASAHVEHEAIREDVRTAMFRLEPADRAVVALRFFADLSVADVAAAVGVPEGTVKSRTRRALVVLREAGLSDVGMVLDG